MSHEYQNATDDIRDISQELEIFMGTCQRCGRCFKEPSPLEQLKLKGFRFDDLENDLFVYDSKSYIDENQATSDIELELD